MRPTEKQKPSNISGANLDSKTQAMFYSQCLLSKKGPLASIWVAGCCFKRLKKSQVTDTHIPSSVDKILVEGLTSVTYRILAYLLLGVVRIYSRKVEYLFQDCHETVCDINRFSVGKKAVPFRDIVRSSHSIILPERYELDAFQLEAADGASGGHIARNEDIILKDVGRETSEQSSLKKNKFDEVSPHWEETSNALTSARISWQQETCLSNQTPDKAVAGRETSTGAFTPPDIVLSPHQMETDVEVTSPDHMKDLQTSKEKLRDLRFSQEEGMNFDDMICGMDVELINLINEYKERKDDGGNVDDLHKAAVEVHEHVVQDDKERPSPMEMEKTPNSDLPDAAGNSIQEFLAVSTPAKKENTQRSAKRKCIIDENLVLDNQTMKQVIHDASDLVCKRRKFPHTVIDLWRFSRIPSLSKNFSEPLIPCAALKLQHFNGTKRTKRERTEASSAAAEPVATTEEAHVKPQDAVSPRTPVSIIAPGTPVRGQTSGRPFASPVAEDSDGEGPVHTYQNVGKELSVNEDEDLGPSLMAEMGANEGDSQELHKNKNELSARTRTVARYLHQVIDKRKQDGEEAVPLIPILRRKTRAESARFFFEILVLTSGGFMNVMQHKAYSDVLLQETPKMQEALVNC